MPSGLDSIISNPKPYQAIRWGLLTNHAAYSDDGVPSRKALLDAGLSIHRLFSPEHGIGADGEDGAPQPDGHDDLTGLKVSSLYGQRWAPDSDMLKGLDAILFDIPDIGCRYYTYLWTMTYMMEACEKNSLPLYVIDRPNPIGTILEHAEGPWLDEKHCSSFIGRWNIPLKHACTMGELAQYFRKQRLPDLELHIIPIPNYRRRHALMTDSFRPTSPAIQHLNSALLYPGLGLLEGVNMNEGRGTAHSFSQFGAPWLDPAQVIKHIQSADRLGIHMTHTEYLAQSNPYAGELCQAIHIQVTDPSKLMAVRVSITLIKAIYDLHTDQLTERLYPTLANPTGIGHLNRLLGLPGAFQKILSDEVIDALPVDNWKHIIDDSLLYQA